MAKHDPELITLINNLTSQAIKEHVQGNITEDVVLGFKAQLDAHMRNFRSEMAKTADEIRKRCDETDDLVSRLVAQIADLDVRRRKYLDGDRYAITKRQVAKLMRDHNG